MAAVAGLLDGPAAPLEIAADGGPDRGLVVHDEHRPGRGPDPGLGFAPAGFARIPSHGTPVEVGEQQGEAGAVLAGTASILRQQAASVLLDDAVAHRETEAGSLPRILRGEERLEEPGEDVGGDAGP